jgi:hypothetical protein
MRATGNGSGTDAVTLFNLEHSRILQAGKPGAPGRREAGAGAFVTKN